MRFGLSPAVYLNSKVADSEIWPGSFFGYERPDEDDYEMTPEETIDFMKKFTRYDQAQQQPS